MINPNQAQQVLREVESGVFAENVEAMIRSCDIIARGLDDFGPDYFRQVRRILDTINGYNEELRNYLRKIQNGDGDDRDEQMIHELLENIDEEQRRLTNGLDGCGEALTNVGRNAQTLEECAVGVRDSLRRCTTVIPRM